jgi:hypothetical protein
MLDTSSTWNKLLCSEIFKYFLIVDLIEKDAINTPQIAFVYPPCLEKDNHLIHSQISKFCFPDADTFPRKIEKNEETFFFTLKGSSVLYVLLYLLFLLC